MTNVLCTICARGGSKGVVNKNIRLLAGKPLIAHTIEQAKKCNLFDHIVISTDSQQIAVIAKEYGAEHFFDRASEHALYSSAKLPVIQHAFKESEKFYQKNFDILVDLDATSPLRRIEDIQNAMEMFLSGDYENLITGTLARRSPYFNLVEVSKEYGVSLSKTLETPVDRRQDAPQCFDMNASIYIWKKDALLHKKSLFGKTTGLFIMPEERSIDIDLESDFEFVEFLMKKRKEDA